MRATGCRTETSLGSGAVVGDGLVATVAHVVAGADQIFVGQDELPASLVAIDTGTDLAVLEVSGLDLPVYRAGAAERDETGVYITYDEGAPVVEPFTVVRPVNLTIGDIYDEGEHRRSGYEITADVEPGDSGAMLFDDAGTAVGMVFASSRLTDGRAWATAISELDPLLANLSTTPLAPGRCGR